jgi:hypothetical protein
MKGQLGRFTLIAGVLAALAPVAAKAQSITESPESRELLSKYGEYFLIGGGVTNYLDHAVRSQVDTGGAWDVRLGIGSRYFVGGELAYVGSARNAGALGKNLFSNGVEGVLRLQYPFDQGRWRVTPFAFGGVGWNHFDINRASAVAARTSDDVLVTPVGAGITVGSDRVIFDTRFTYRQTYNENLVQNADGSDASLKNWAVTASIGYEF